MKNILKYGTMRKILLVVFAAASMTLTAQQRISTKPSYCDPAVSNLVFTDASNSVVNLDRLVVGTPVNLAFTLGNTDALNAVPAGTCQVKITLGSMFRLVTDLSSMNLPLREYITWSIASAPRSMQLIITGELYRELPPRFSGVVKFTLMPAVIGSSTATCQVLVSNHNNDRDILSDMVPGNNFVAATYRNTKPIGIKFTQFDAKPHGCVVGLDWAVFDEDKLVKKYIIEVSDDGINFQPFKTILSNGGSSFSQLLEGLNRKEVTVRIKAVTEDGQFVYSGMVYRGNLCNGKFDIGLFPNPVATDVTEVTLQAKAGIFNGRDSIMMTDAMGKEVKKTEANYTNQLQVSFKTGFISAGTYFVTVTGEDGVASMVRFVKQ